MTIAEAKQLRIVDYLASLGYHPQSVTSKQYWYLSILSIYLTILLLSVQKYYLLYIT